MKSAPALVLSAALTTLPMAPAAAQSVVADPAEGRELAAKLCSNCHVTDGNGSPTPRADVPSFAAIANGPRTTPESLAAAIILPHPEMPGIALTRAEIRAVIAYIMSLRK